MPPFVTRKRLASTPPPAEHTPKKRKPAPRSTTVHSPATSSVHEKKKFLDSLAGSDDSDLSDADSDDFKDVLPKSQGMPGTESEEDEDMDWEDAIQVKEQPKPATLPAPDITADLELTLGGPGEQASFTDGKKKGPSKIERQIRISTHCMHVQFLMFHNTLRNAWACDKKVHDILLGQLPPQVKEVVEAWRKDCGDTLEPAASGKKVPQRVNGKQRGGKKRQPRKQRDWGGEAERLEEGAPNLSRADPTLRLLKYLARYWNKNFRITAPGLRKTGYKPVRALQEEIVSFHNDPHDPEEHGERVSSVRMFRDCAKRREGSRDIGAQLFTALVRSLGIEARLVANLQPIGFGWNKNEEAPPRRKKKENKEPVDLSSESEENGAEAGGFETEPKPTKPRKMPDKAPSSAKKSTSHNLRNGTAEMPVDLSSSSELSDVPSESDESIIDVTPHQRKPNRKYDRDLHFPIYWTEVVSPITFKVYPVDPILMLAAPATNDEQLLLFEPRGSKADKARQVLAYVVAHSPDGTAKDVTTRYLKRHLWPGKTKGARLPPEKVPIYNKKGKIKRYEEYDWFKTVMSSYKRRDRLRTQVDDIEEAAELQPAKIEKKLIKEGEESLQWYKQSADYVLERFLRREEALVPGAEAVRTFKNGKGEKAKEPVFLRKDVVPCKTEESWHKEGRQPKSDAEPLKRVPIRAVTLTRKREIEDFVRQHNGVKPTQGLYAKNQTEWIIPPPIQNGVIPKNQYGNMDCFVPSMIPKGAVHVPLRSTVRVCKKLSIDYAEAVVGFEFGNKLAVPIIEGVIVAKENEHTLIDAWEEEEVVRQMKEDEKRQKLILSTWRKFLMGLRILTRMRDDYRDDPNAHVKEAMNPFTNPNKVSESKPQAEEDLSGGFLHGEEEDEEDAGEASELEIVEPQKDGPDTSMGGRFMTDTPEEPVDQVFDNSRRDSVSSGLSSDDEMPEEAKPSESEDDDDEEPPPNPTRKRTATKTAPAKVKVQPKAEVTARRSSRRSGVKSQYFDSSLDEEEDDEDEVDLAEDEDEDEDEYKAASPGPPAKSSRRGRGKKAVPARAKREMKGQQKQTRRGRPRKTV